MEEINIINNINDSKPDDILITATSFEPRCLGVCKLISKAYKAKLCFIAHFKSNSSGMGENSRKSNTATMKEILNEVDLCRNPRLKLISPYDPFQLWDKFYNESSKRNIALNNSNISIDISCFTKIQLMFLLRNLSSQLESGTLRLFYTIPKAYNSEHPNKKNLIYGYQKYFLIPFEKNQVKLKSQFDRIKKVCFVEIGHEGDRILNIWRAINPEKTIIIRAISKDSRLVEETDRNNKFLMDHYHQNDPSYKLIVKERNKVDELRDEIEKIYLEEKKNGRLEVNIIPFGPKPFIVSIVKWAISHPNQMINVGYSIPRGYNGDYSKGIRKVYEHKWILDCANNSARA
jgi:hypothetical protein